MDLEPEAARNREIIHRSVVVRSRVTELLPIIEVTG